MPCRGAQSKQLNPFHPERVDSDAQNVFTPDLYLRVQVGESRNTKSFGSTTRLANRPSGVKHQYTQVAVSVGP